MYIAEDVRIKIEDCLTKNNKPMSATEIANEIGDISTQRATAILKSMVYYGLIKRCIITTDNIHYAKYTHNDYEEEIVIDYEIASEKEEIRFAIENFFDRIATFIEKSVDFFILYWYN